MQDNTTSASESRITGTRVVQIGIAAVVAILAVAAILLFSYLPDANEFNDAVREIFLVNDALTTTESIRILEILAQSGTTFSKVLASYRAIIFVLIVFATALLIACLVFLVTIVGIIFVQEGARRIPIVSAKRQVGGAGVLPTRQSYLPLKLNAGGVMPIIFASALIFLPVTVANLTSNEWLIRAASALNPGAPNPWPYALAFFALILGFSYFYASLTVNPADIASNLKKGGVAIPGVRPGSATATYLSGVQNRLTLLGGLFLGAVAIIPAAVERATNVQTFQGLGATSLLILVGVAIDTAKQVQTYVISQRYEGLVRQ